MKNKKRQEIKLSSIMMMFNTSLIVWCLCLISYGLVSRDGWVYIFLIVNAVSFYYYGAKIKSLI